MLHPKVPSSKKALRVEPSCPIKRFRDWCSPIHNHRLVVLIRDSKAPNVENFRLTVGSGDIDATKSQRLIPNFELLEPSQ
jgi:hypothetical protein